MSTELLPKDDASFGFDNVSAVGLSPTLVERYLTAAQKVTRLAVGSPLPAPAVRVVTLPPDLTQEDHVDGLPFGTRGGTLVRHTFPRDGEYEIQVRLMRNRNENVEGLNEPHQIEVILDGQRLAAVHGDAEPQPDGRLLRGRGRRQASAAAHASQRRTA